MAKSAAVSAAALAFALCASVVFATPPAGTSRDRFVVDAVHTDTAPHIDGVLDDEMWAAAPVIDAFVQQDPNEGAPATERTEVRVLYDARRLYLAVHAFDSEPASIVATEMRRDSDRLLDEDSFQVIVDTFDDARNGYMFVTTPLGAKLEQQISDEGEGAPRGNTTATNPNVNLNWDGVWDVATRRTSDGWTAEIVIPMASLRFSSAPVQTWGLNFMRNIRRKNEQVFWAPIPKAYTLTRVSLAGSLRGLQSLERGLDLKVKPYVLGGVHADRAHAGAPLTSTLHDAGLDVKYGVTGGLTLDLTYNTDFAQVEADEQQVNLTRFSVVFPEKRDFFLENAGLFNFGTGSMFSPSPLGTDVFFSRRIGLSDTGQPIPILGGARLAGKAGPNNIGVLDLQTDGTDGQPGDNFFVGRYSRDVLKRSRLGAIVVNKEATGGGSRYNRSVGADANFVFGRGLQLNSFVAKTATPGLEGSNAAMFGRVAYRTPAWNVYTNYMEVQEHFNAEVGLVQRTGVRTFKSYVSRTPRPRRGVFRVLEPMYVLTYVTDMTGRMVGRKNHHMLGATLKDGSSFSLIYDRELDVQDGPFEMARGVIVPAGMHRYNSFELDYNTNPARRFYERLKWSPEVFYTFYGGKRREVNLAVGTRATSSLSAELQFKHNHVRMPYGEFLVNLSILRVDYALSPRNTIRTLTQYNSATHDLTTSIRFNLIYRPGSDLYVVYNDLERTGVPADVFAPSDRQIAIKWNYLLAR